jgi:2-desacetyl-2-hydroxyethyl bacteriochlorophyllide A dehydrogenase
MKAAIIEAPGDIRVGTVPDPTPAPGQIVVKVAACGVCGTDLHIADGDLPAAQYPIVPGHELAGEVVAVGGDVSDLAEGNRVAVDPSLYCGHCRFCRVGRDNLCENYNAVGVTVPGGGAEYVAVPAGNAYVVPVGLSYRRAALIEPLSCAVHGMHVLSARMGDSFVIVGAGTMGLMLLQLALRGNASKVAVVDLNEDRLARARRLGATSTTTDAASLREDAPLGFDCVIEATGVPAAIEGAFDMVTRGGKLLVFGVAPPEARVSLPPFRIYNDEITVLGSMAVQNSYAPAVELMVSGAFDADALLTETASLDEYPAALDAVRRQDGLKTQVLPSGPGAV